MENLMSKFEKPFPLGRGWGRLPKKSNNFESFFVDSTLTFLTFGNTFRLPILPIRRVVFLCLPLIFLCLPLIFLCLPLIFPGCASKIPDFKGKETKKGGAFLQSTQNIFHTQWSTWPSPNPIATKQIGYYDTPPPKHFPHPTPFFGFNTSCFWRWKVLYLYRDMGGASAPPFFRHFPFKIGDFRSASGKNLPSSNFNLPSSSLN